MQRLDPVITLKTGKANATGEKPSHNDENEDSNEGGEEEEEEDEAHSENGSEPKGA